MKEMERGVVGGGVASKGCATMESYQIGFENSARNLYFWLKELAYIGLLTILPVVTGENP